MTPRRIVGIGEALLLERGGQLAPGGLTIEIALWAKRFGHVGLPISRLGQDDRAKRILNALRKHELDASHMQSDPDLPTGRRVVRLIGGREVPGSARIDDRAAFDNMQWDFDLVDIAHEADAVVFGMTAQRGGLSGSVIRRFLSECTGALRVLDLTNRNGESFDRSQALRNLETTDIVVLDRSAAAILLHRSEMPDLSSPNVIKRILDSGSAVIVVTVNDDAPPVLHAGESPVPASQRWSADVHAPMLMSILHAQLRGDDLSATASLIDRICEHVRNQPDSNVPTTLLR